MHKKTLKFESILFDLDGTLIDTASELANALNAVLQNENKTPLPLSEIRQVASDGAPGLINLGFHITTAHPDFTRLKEKLIQYYSANIGNKSVLFPGIDKILRHCSENKIPWGIVTNKPSYLTDRLIKKLRLDTLTQCIVSGDTLKQRKPDPAPLIYAAKILNLSPENCCYIGDAERDIVAAKACNMYAIAALYGYLQKDADPYSWHANAYVNSSEELMDLVF
jgi:2-phosphoglycolate phosphatase